MPYFFNGRLWVSPATMSAVNDSAMANQNSSVGNTVAFVGLSAGGQPNTPLVFGSPQQAQATLISGELCQAVMKAFSPSNDTGAPATVIAVRANPAIQSALLVNDSTSAPSINLLSADYGAYTNQIAASFAVGSVQGVKSTVSLGSTVYSQDNIYNPLFQIQYVGAAASASMTITGTTVTLSAPTGTPVATANLATFPTVQQLVSYLSSTPGFSATVMNANGSDATLNSLDYVVAQDVKTSAYAATGNLTALIAWLNSTNLVVATSAVNAGRVPAPIPSTFLSGGSDGVATTTNWANAFTTLQSVDVQWITPISSDPSVAAMTDAHVQYMSTVGRKERRAIVGTALNTTDAQAIAAALAINSDRTSLVHIGYNDYDLTGQNSTLNLYAPYMAAAVISAAFSGVNPGTPLTNKSLTFRGVERILLNPTNTDPLINGGVLAVESTANGYKVVESVSTWLNSTAYDKVQQSTGVALDYTCRSVRQALDVLRGQKNTPYTLGRAVSITDSTLRQLAIPEPQGVGVLAGNKTSPAYANITASAIGDVLAVQFQCSPVIGVDFIPVTVFAVPFTGTATA